MITDKKTVELSTKILKVFDEESGFTIKQFLDALTLSQSRIVSHATYSGIREIAAEIRDQIVANATCIKESTY